VNQGARALNRTALTLLAAAATGIQVGAAITATRFAVDMIGPASLAFLRYAIGTACLAPVLLSGRVRFARGSRAVISCRSRCSASASSAC
jgi:hypothetical protein